MKIEQSDFDFTEKDIFDNTRPVIEHIIETLDSRDEAVRMMRQLVIACENGDEQRIEELLSVPPIVTIPDRDLFNNINPDEFDEYWHIVDEQPFDDAIVDKIAGRDLTECIDVIASSIACRAMACYEDLANEIANDKSTKGTVISALSRHSLPQVFASGTRVIEQDITLRLPVRITYNVETVIPADDMPF